MHHSNKSKGVFHVAFILQETDWDSESFTVVIFENGWPAGPSTKPTGLICVPVLQDKWATMTEPTIYWQNRFAGDDYQRSKPNSYNNKNIHLFWKIKAFPLRSARFW